MERTLTQPAEQVLVPPIAITDGELLMQFARHGDEQAFARLVEKHGRLVWTVCWQVLREHHAIEDAFQSTFFILAKRAGSIRSCDSLCGWLYRVAYRTALRARMSSKSKPVIDLGAGVDTMEEWSALDEKLHAIEQDEQRATLLEELHALPEKYQQVLALCYLEGKPRRVIADELGCSLETVKGRLARGRQVLRHRLIRRGVSLSLAMAAMTVPVKSATAAVTPGLIGLTATGAAAWAAGTLATAEVVSGTGAAKVAATASSHVIHLAHQGTVAMTIASFAKPAIVAIALLGAVSGTLAVDSADSSPHSGTASAINLSADTAALADGASQAAATDVTLAASDAAASGAEQADAVDKKHVAAPPNAPQPAKSYPPVPMPPTPLANWPVPAMPPMPGVPVTAPVDVQVPKLDLKLQLKLAALEAHVSELLLESKNLEIESMTAPSEEEKLILLRKSREKLAMAEAEKLKIQLEQQKEQIKALEEALKQQAKDLSKQAAQMAMDSELVAEQAAKIEQQAEQSARAGALQAAAQAKEAARHAAEGATLRIQERAVIVDPSTGQAIAANRYPVVSGLPAWEQSVEAQQGALSLKPGDQIRIEALGTLPDRPIHAVYTIEPMGTVALGVGYGRAEVAGLSVIEAEKAIKDQLSKVVADPDVQVTYLPPAVTYTPAPNFPRYAPESHSESSKDKASK